MDRNKYLPKRNLSNLSEAIAAAEEELERLVPRGDKRWQVSIPVRDDDSDIIMYDLLREARKAQELIKNMREPLAFAMSVIKCGEPWTETCERVIGGAIRDVVSYD